MATTKFPVTRFSIDLVSMIWKLDIFGGTTLTTVSGFRSKKFENSFNELDVADDVDVDVDDLKAPNGQKLKG